MDYEWHVTQLTPEAALQHARRIRGLAHDVTLGWTPYNYLVTYGAVSQWACHTEVEFDARCRSQGLTIVKWGEWENGIRSAWLVKGGDES